MDFRGSYSNPETDRKLHERRHVRHANGARRPLLSELWASPGQHQLVGGRATWEFARSENSHRVYQSQRTSDVGRRSRHLTFGIRLIFLFAPGEQ
jgi:hypothetical protein